MTWGVTFVTMISFHTFLYIKYISSILAIDCRRCDCSSVCHSGLSISNISASGALFFPSTIFWDMTIIGPGGICPCSLLYRLWKKIAFAKILKSSTCNIVKSMNFRLICVEVFNWENLSWETFRFQKKFFRWSIVLWKNKPRLFFIV